MKRQHYVTVFQQRLTFTIPKLIEHHNATGRPQAGANQSEVARHMGFCTATINRLWVRHTYTDPLVTDLPRASTPAQDRYIRLMHLRDRIGTATSTASQISGLRVISPPPPPPTPSKNKNKQQQKKRLHQTSLQARQRYHDISSR